MDATSQIGILGRKIGMSQIFTEQGQVIPVTVIEGGPCPITQVKTAEKDGYSAIQMGFQQKKKKKAKPFRILREFRILDVSPCQVGQSLTADQFKVGDYVDVRGTTIGKGFQGGVKRWGWAGGGSSHGSMQHRQPGSIGSNTTPGRVLRGHHLPGHTGNQLRTVQNLKILKVDKEHNLLVINGSAPGSVNSYLEIRPAVKKKNKTKE